MSYIQVVNPDLNTVGDVGWCLAFAEKAYNATTYSYPTATSAWKAVEDPHEDRNLPSDVIVPIWFSYFEGGVDYGHVALNVPGRGVLSSPYKADNTQQWFTDIDECARVLNCHYLGWSEDIAGVTVVKQGDDMKKPIDPELVWEHYINYTGVDVGKGSPATQNRFEDPEDDEFWFGLVPMMNNIRNQQVQEITQLKDQLAQTPVQTVTLNQSPAPSASPLDPPVIPEASPPAAPKQSFLAILKSLASKLIIGKKR